MGVLISFKIKILLFTCEMARIISVLLNFLKGYIIIVILMLTGTIFGN